MSILHRPSPALVTSLFLQLATTLAQHNAPLQGPSLTAPAATSSIFLSPAALTSAANPFDTDSSDDSDSDSNSRNVLNYYFLILIGFVFVIIVLYWILIRKRKRRFAQAHVRAQSALAADLERWPGSGGPRGPFATTRTGRWHVLRTARHHEGRHQEGLNEDGEAPPAYVAKPEPVHSGDASTPGAPSSAQSSTPEWIEMAGKPPDYQERPHT